ncbi:hypothetical protein [Arthrobacter sp. ok362]|uniref:hypothetical protein n=1 Tax=Arthrobacter sp. ok362 TaxID=1761745 RepID=UPI00088ED66F|nr:hypothetical protein [Arthrobacter sp. ok362]SDL24583.1 hypothetical protein SAMN04487913_107156 [Arthrobacter sp. ok362]
MVFLRKTEDGTLETAEISDLDPSELGEVRMAEADLAMVLSEHVPLASVSRFACEAGATDTELFSFLALSFGLEQDPRSAVAASRRLRPNLPGNPGQSCRKP